MLPQSIRWRLPLNYGAIAFLATLCLGVILLITLERYYNRQEIGYLEQNARALGPLLESALEHSSDPTLVNPQIETFAYLTQTRVRLLDDSLNVLADSGSPGEQTAVVTLSIEVAADNVRQAFSQTIDESGAGQVATTQLIVDDGRQSIRSETAVRGDPATTLATPLNALRPAGDAERSSHVYRLPLAHFRLSTLDVDGDAIGLNEVIGYLELSEGPAFGRPIVATVAGVLLLAGALAVLLTTSLGYALSGRLSRPLLSLAGAARRMAAGDLTARSDIRRADEIGAVGAAFNQMADQVEQTVATLRRFVADAAHELNTPLTALRTQVEMARAAAPETPFLVDALVETERLAGLTSNLLHLSKLESGPVDPPVPLDWRAVVAAQSEGAATRAEQADVDFQLELPADPLPICGRPEHVRRLVDNLLDNALKFTPPGGAIRVDLHRAGDTAVLTVTDTGIGLAGPPDALFDRFHRGANAAAVPGSGLGLAIVQQIAIQHGGGVIALPATPGARFVVTLPLGR